MEKKNGGSATGSFQESAFYSNQNKGRGRERGSFGGHSTIKTSSNNKKTNPMEEDVVTLEAGGAKEDEVHGKEINK